MGVGAFIGWAIKNGMIGPELRVALGALAAGVVAVPYTHLRAHETVLDLVCRLLLEKNTTIGDLAKIIRI